MLAAASGTKACALPKLRRAGDLSLTALRLQVLDGQEVEEEEEGADAGTQFVEDDGEEGEESEEEEEEVGGALGVHRYIGNISP